MSSTLLSAEVRPKSFDSSEDRETFISRVYLTVAFELALTGFLAFSIQSNDDWMIEVDKNVLAWFVLSISLLLLLTFFHNIEPLNYFLLLGFCITEGFIVADTIWRYQTQSILIAIILTSLIFAVLTVMAFSLGEKYILEGTLLLIALGIIICLTFCNYILKSNTLDLLIAGVSSLIFSAYILYDTQMTIACIHRPTITSKDFIYASISLYIDFICLAMSCLRLFGHYSFFVEDDNYRKRRRKIPGMIFM